jgi:hypothetical protein
MTIAGNSKVFYNTFTARPAVTFSASSKAIIEGFTYSNWYGYGRIEPELVKYKDETGKKKMEYVEDETNYFFPAFFMEFYPIDMEMTFGIVGGDLSIYTPVYPVIEMGSSLEASSYFTQKRLDAFRYMTGIGQLEDRIAALGAKAIETAASVASDIKKSGAEMLLSASQSDASTVSNTNPGPEAPKPVRWKFMVFAAGAGQSADQFAKEAGEKATRELVEKAAKNVSDTADAAATATAKRGQLQVEVDTATTRVKDAHKQVTDQSKLVSDTKKARDIAQSNVGSAQASVDTLSDKIADFEAEADMLRNFNLSYREKGLEVPAWCNQNAIDVKVNEGMNVRIDTANDRLAESQNELSRLNETLRTQETGLLDAQENFRKANQELFNAEINLNYAQTDFITKTDAERIARDYHELLMDRLTENDLDLSKTSEYMGLDTTNFSKLRDGNTIDWTDLDNVTNFFNYIDDCTNYLTGIHGYNTIIRAFGREWVDFCKYDWGERLIENYGVASNYNDYEDEDD